MFWVPTTGRALDLRDLAYSFQTFCELWDFRGGSEGVSYLPKVTRLKSSRTRIGTQMGQGGKGRVWGTFRVTNGGRPSRRHGVSPLQPGALPVPYHPPPPVSPREGWESLQLLLQTGHWGPGSKLVLHLPGDDITPRNGQFANPAWPPRTSTPTPFCLWGREGRALLGTSAFHKGNSRPREGRAWPAVTQRTDAGRGQNQRPSASLGLCRAVRVLENHPPLTG